CAPRCRQRTAARRRRARLSVQRWPSLHRSGKRRRASRRSRRGARGLHRALRRRAYCSRPAIRRRRHPPCRARAGRGRRRAIAAVVRRPGRAASGGAMSLALLAPLGLFALAALALPILVHLVRRIELHATEFAALRWISARVPPRRRIRFERPWLLLLRLLLVALLALLLARP